MTTNPILEEIHRSLITFNWPMLTTILETYLNRCMLMGGQEFMKHWAKKEDNGSVEENFVRASKIKKDW